MRLPGHYWLLIFELLIDIGKINTRYPIIQ